MAKGILQIWLILLLLLLFSCSVLSDSFWPHGPQHTRLPCPYISQILLKLTSTESVMPSNHLILCRPFLLLPSIFPSIRVFSKESAICIRWPDYWYFSFSICPSNKYSYPGLISFTIDQFDLLQSRELSRVFSNTTFRKHQFFSSQTSLWSESHMYMTTGKTIALTRLTFVSKVYLCILICHLGLS